MEREIVQKFASVRVDRAKVAIAVGALGRANANDFESSLLNHPGNQLLTHFGLALSARLVEHRDAAFPMQTAKAGRDFLLPFFQKYLNSTLL